MRNVFSPQMSIGQTGIADIQIDVSSRDDIPVILLGLQHIYTTQPLRDAVFKILEEVAPTKLDNDEARVVSINKGRPGMDQWSILVLGALRLGLNTDYDRILELANQHRTIREMLGLGCFDADKRYCLQTLKDNLQLFTSKEMARINVEVIRAGYRLLDLDVHAMIRGRCDSFVLKTDVHFPTDTNLLYDAIRTLIHVCAKWHAQQVCQAGGIMKVTGVNSNASIASYRSSSIRPLKMKTKKPLKNLRSSKPIRTTLIWQGSILSALRPV
jgi:hypothetical protein